MKKIISIVLVCAVLFSMMAVQAEDVATSGVCGLDMTWRFEGDTLYIEGSGIMDDFEDGKQPWIQFKDQMKNVYISDGITSVGNMAFGRYSGITELYLPDSIETIGNQTFFKALSMEELKLPANLKSIGSYGFGYTNVYKFILNANTSYPGWCFQWTEAGEIVLPSNMKALSSYMFTQAYKLKKINIPEGLTSFGNSVFEECTSLQEITLPKSLNSIGNTVFKKCTNLNEVVVLNPNMQYGTDVFADAREVTLLGEVGSTTEAYANANGINFKPINTIGSNIKWLISKGVLRIEGNGAIPNFEEGGTPWNSDADEITSVTISEGINSIGNYAFADIGEIEDISLPTSLSKVSETAFGDMELFKIIRENVGIAPLGTIYTIRVLKNDNNIYSLMLGVAVYEEEMGEDGIYLKTKGIKFTPVVIDTDKRGVDNYNASTVGSNETNVVKTFLWEYPYMTDFKTNAEQGTNKLSSEKYSYINDGKIKISGSLGSDATGEVTLFIVPEECDMSDEETWQTAAPVHADCQTVDYDGGYEFNVAFAKEGAYKAYIGNSSLESPREITVIYTNKENSKQAISELNGAVSAEEVKSLMNNKISLQLFSDLYDENIGDEEIVKSASEILFAYLENETVEDGDDAQAAIYKALVITLINSDKIDDITKYAEEISINDKEALDYIKFEKGNDITEMVKSCQNDSIENFDKNYTEAILRTLIKYNNGTDEIKNGLIKYADLIGINESDITDSLCQSMAGTDFASLDKIAEYVDSYEAPSQGGGGGGSSGGGGGSSAGGGSSKKDKETGKFDNHTFEITNSETENSGVIQVNPFDDLKGFEWAESSIVNLFKKGVVSGKAERSFCPQDNITREEFAKLVAAAVNINVKSNAVPFEDVSEGDWFYEYVSTLYSAGIINGVNETMFGTGTKITRQDAVVMIDRVMEKCSLIEEDYEKVDDFRDSILISDYALESINRLKSNGLIAGDENNSFNPKNFITRAEAAVMIFRVYEKATATN